MIASWFFSMGRFCLVGAVAGGLCAAAALASAAEPRPDGRGRILAPDAHALAAEGTIVLVDVRHPREWRDTGLPKSGVAISMHDPRGFEWFERRLLIAVGGDKSKPVATICATGVRSARMRRLLGVRGWTRVYDVSEGMLGRGDDWPGWRNRGLPIRAYEE